MTEIFHYIVNITFSAAALVAAVLIYRFVFRKAPKWINCALWAVVGLRLIFPLPLETFAGLLPRKTIIDSGNVVNVFSPVPAGALNSVPGTAVNVTPPVSYAGFNLDDILNTIYFAIWIVGIAVMLIGGAVSYIKMSRGLKAAVKVKERVYSCDYVDTAFILGVFRPKIYIPSSVDETKLECILAHENAHLKRHDHWWKPLGYLLLSVYWFNPAVWAAYIFLCRDIELACDEKVIKNMTKEESADYSQALLDYSKPKKILTVCPVAFGETGVKQRVKSVLNYKKPAFWIIIIALIAGIAVSVCFGTSRISDNLPTNTYIDYYIVALDVNTQDRLVCYEIGEKNELVKLDERFTSDYSQSMAKSWVAELAGESRKITDADANEITVFNIDKLPENEKVYAAFSSSEIVGSEYDSYVSKAILDSEELDDRAEFEAEGHYIMDTEEKGNTVKIYALTRYSGFRFENGVFMDSTGFAAPAVITVNKSTGETSMELPGDGTEYPKDIKRMFPLKCRVMINSDSVYGALMSEQVVSQARAYLDSIGRTEQICNYGDVMHVFPSDVGAPENLRLPENYLDEIGSVERLEDGERFVYETRYDKESNAITCFKHKYDSDEMIEYIAYDITTGEVKSTVSYPIKKLPGMIMSEIHVSQIVDGKIGNLAYGLRDEDAKVISNFISKIENDNLWTFSYDNISDFCFDFADGKKYYYDSSSGIITESDEKAYSLNELNRVEINRIIGNYIQLAEDAVEYSTVAVSSPDSSTAAYYIDN